MADDQTPKLHIPEPKLYSDSGTMVLYSNYTAITMTPDEVVFRFAGRDLEDAEKALEVARVVVSPAHAKRILTILANLVQIYETNFGKISIDPVDRLTLEGRKNLGLAKLESPESQ